MLTKRLSLLFSLIFYCCFSWCQFAEQQTIFGYQMERPQDMRHYDFNDDGNLDLIIGGESKVAVYLNDGQQIFGKEIVLANLSQFVRAVFDVGDYDQDGDLDVLVFQDNNNEVRVYENDGSGDFNSGNVLMEEDGVRQIIWKDFNGDGDLDVLLRTFVPQSNQELIWYENTGGIFNNVYTLASEFEVRSVITADIDNDDDLDIIYNYRDAGISYVALLKYNPDLFNFDPAIIISPASTSTVVDQFAIHDLDGDGLLDVITNVGFLGKLNWIKNNGSDDFSDPESLVDGSINFRNIQLTHVNDDDFLDILGTVTEDDKIVYYAGIDSTSFENNETLLSNQPSPYIAQMVDLDSDADLDLLFGSFFYDEVKWLERDGESFIREFVVCDAATIGLVRGIALADLDGDHYKDLVAGTSWGDKVVWHKNNGANAYGEQIVIAEDTDYSQGPFLRLVDMDNDNDIDIVSGSINSFPRNMVWYPNDGEGNFDPPVVLPYQLSSIPRITFRDIDQDGDFDFIDGSENQPSWFENINNGQAFTPRSLPTIPGGNNIFQNVVDFDLDGDLDLVFVNTGDAGFFWMENDGDNNFGEAITMLDPTLGERAYSLADIDNDEDFDLIAANFNLNRIGIYYNEGENNFSDEVIIEDFPGGVYYLNTADFDLDGDFDILYYTEDFGRVYWNKNDGFGNFSDAILITSGIGSNSAIAMTDMESDGDLDLFVTDIIPDIFDDFYRIAHVENFSDRAKVSGLVYWDENMNQERDSQEVLISEGIVQLTPEADLTWTNDGRFDFYVNPGQYTLELEQTDNWQFTTDSIVDIELANLLDIAEYEFGIIPVNPIDSLSFHLSSGPTRCGFTIPFWVDFTNNGTTIIDGQLRLDLDSLSTLVSSSPEPDSIFENTLFWDFEQLYPTYKHEAFLELIIPGPEYIDSFLYFQATTDIYETDGNIYYSDTSLVYAPQIRCAYDPNDKLVEPDREGDENYTLFEELLKYTIRFQNTGTDTAFNVIITDYLDENLDWSTFQPLSASHPYQVTLEASGKLIFRFNDILLPDSTTNEILSHGYVAFQIKPLDGLAENTIIENTANIFFDFNPAIVTNTTVNTMVSELPFLESVSPSPESRIALSVFPNPFSQQVTFRIDDQNNTKDYMISIVDLTGKQLDAFSLQSGQQSVYSRDQLPAGIYFYQVIDSRNLIVASGKIIAQ